MRACCQGHGSRHLLSRSDRFPDRTGETTTRSANHPLALRWLGMSGVSQGKDKLISMENQAHLKVFRSSLGHPTTIARRPRRRAIDQRSDTIAVIDEAIKALNAANLLTQRKRTRDDRVHAVDYIETAVRKLREYQR